MSHNIFPGKASTTSNDPDAAMREAQEHFKLHRWNQAEEVLRGVLKFQPGNTDAALLLALSLLHSGRPKVAITILNRAIEHKPEAALLHANLGEIQRQQGDLPGAITSLKRAQALDPGLALAHSNLGVAYFFAGEFQAAEENLRRALALAPFDLSAQNALGAVLKQQGDIAGAIACFRAILASLPDHPDTLNNLGTCLLETEEFQEAASVLEKARDLAPRQPDILTNLGLLREKQGKLEEAETLLRQSLAILPGSATALLGLGKTLYRKDALAEAEDSTRKALALAPKQGEAWCLLGLVQAARGKEEDAADSYKRSLELRPDDATALCGQAHILARGGQLEEANVLLKRALERNPNHVASLYALVTRRKVGPDDQELRTLRSLLSRAGDLSPDDRQSIHFALGKALDDLRDYGQAFPHFLEGNRLKRLTLDFDPDVDTKTTDLTISLFTQKLFERLQDKGFRTDLPIFVLGMPRSGTTLTEQILASHPEVYGAGELSLLMDILTSSDARHRRVPFPNSLSTLKRETVKRWGKDYTSQLREYAPRARRITNKMPANYKALGVIRLMLPEARIIHVRRNAVDTCLSCFMQSFLHGQEATYDLTDLGRHYVNYARLMEHWRAVLPEGSFLEVQYEDLVADTEVQARRLVEYCGLKWDDACLAFHKAERFVRTASIAQVRQPIYHSSVERWRKYEKFLGPLLEALGEYAP